MAQKRASDALVAMPDMKRSRNELVAITNRDKALLEAVSKSFVRISCDEKKNMIQIQIQIFVGCETDIELICTDYAVGRT